jgi:tetratricopeptide (TPR) repeat protein
MQDAPEPTALEHARQASRQGRWQDAYEHLLDADAQSPLSAEDLPFLATVAYAAGHLDAAIDAWERAHAMAILGGNRVAAAGAAARVAMHLLFDTALLAPVRAWLSRADQLLEGEADTPVHAWIAIVRNYERLLSGDFDAALQWARRAIAIASDHDAAAAAIARIAEARNLILQGDVANGLRLLNDAGVATVSGEIDPLSTGIVYCELVCALQALGQYDLAEQWTEAMERWRHGQPVGSLHGRCRVHRAEILRLRGACAEAEREAREAYEELRPYLRRELGWPLTELGRIRLRMGDLDGAEDAFLEAHTRGWDPHPGLAMVYLAQGHVDRAAASIQDALDRPTMVPSKEWPPNTDLRRAPLLEAQVQIAIAAHDLECARAAAAELDRIAVHFHSAGLAASAALSRARLRLAEGALPDARREFESAAHQWSAIGAPYEFAMARIGAGDVLRAQGDEARARVEFEAARTILEQIGASAGEAAKVAPSVVEQPPLGDAPTFLREGDYWSLAFDSSVVRVRDAKGMRYLARLLSQPEHEFHVLDLVSHDRSPGWIDSSDSSAHALDGDAGELLDARAKAAYRRRLTEIEEDVAAARAVGDASRAAQAEGERDFLVRELSRAVGLGGRDRRAGSAAERARSAVTRAIRQALTRIEALHRALADHLNRTIRTGTYCAYSPDPRAPITWKTSD